MPEIANSPSFEYTDGALKIHIFTEHDMQGSEYTTMMILTADNQRIAPNLSLHTEDMKIVAQAIKEYYD